MKEEGDGSGGAAAAGCSGAVGAIGGAVGPGRQEGPHGAPQEIPILVQSDEGHH